MISVQLNVIGGKHAGQKIALDRKKFLIGREQDCQLRPNSELVSRHHCVFTVDDFAVRLRDLGSTNGTVVNGEKIRKEVVLQQGDHVVVGSLEFDVCINESVESDPVSPALPDSTETVIGGADTLSEMTPIKPGQDVAAENQPSPTQTPLEMPAIPVQPGQPTAGDTTVIGQPVLMPGQTPYQPMMPPQAGYPMYGGYPYPGMQAPQMPMYPGHGYPMPQMPQAPPAPVESAEPASQKFPEVSLPDPSTTGAQAEAPKPAASPPPEDGSEAPKAEKSNESADAIIKNYMKRRPGG